MSVWNRRNSNRILIVSAIAGLATLLVNITMDIPSGVQVIMLGLNLMLLSIGIVWTFTNQSGGNS